MSYYCFWLYWILLACVALLCCILCVKLHFMAQIRERSIFQHDYYPSHVPLPLLPFTLTLILPEHYLPPLITSFSPTDTHKHTNTHTHTLTHSNKEQWQSTCSPVMQRVKLIVYPEVRSHEPWKHHHKSRIRCWRMVLSSTDSSIRNYRSVTLIQNSKYENALSYSLPSHHVPSRFLRLSPSPGLEFYSNILLFWIGCMVRWYGMFRVLYYYSRPQDCVAGRYRIWPFGVLYNFAWLSFWCRHASDRTQDV